jgi:hypothetical protein
MYVGMRLNDYTSTDVVLRRQNLDKWHTFTKVTNTARTLQGWRSNKLSLKNATYALPASFFNSVGGTATHNLRLTNDAAWVIGANVFNGVQSGDVLVLSLTTSNTGDLASATTTQAVSAAVTLNLEVAQVVPDSDVSTRGYIVFKQLVQEVRALTGFTGLVTNEVGVGPAAGGRHPPPRSFAGTGNRRDRQWPCRIDLRRRLPRDQSPGQRFVGFAVRDALRRTCRSRRPGGRHPLRPDQSALGFIGDNPGHPQPLEGRLRRRPCWPARRKPLETGRPRLRYPVP